MPVICNLADDSTGDPNTPAFKKQRLKQLGVADKLRNHISRAGVKFSYASRSNVRASFYFIPCVNRGFVFFLMRCCFSNMREVEVGTRQ